MHTHYPDACRPADPATATPCGHPDCPGQLYIPGVAPTDYGRTKYRRRIQDIDNPNAVVVDVYSVLEAFGVTCPARAHAIKKLLAAGVRGKGNEVSDLEEAKVAIERMQ